MIESDRDIERRRRVALYFAVEALRGTASADDPVVAIRFAASYESYLKDGAGEHYLDPGRVSPSGKRLCICGDLWTCSTMSQEEEA